MDTGLLTNTLNVAVPPAALTVWLWGWAVMTASVTLTLSTLPAELETVTL